MFDYLEKLHKALNTNIFYTTNEQQKMVFDFYIFITMAPLVLGLFLIGVYFLFEFSNKDF